MTKGVDERIEEGILRGFIHAERMENNRIAKRVYVGEYAGSPSMRRSWKRWIDTVKDCLKKKGSDVRQARRMVHDRGVWRGYVRENGWGVARGIDPWF